MNYGKSVAEIRKLMDKDRVITSGISRAGRRSE